MISTATLGQLSAIARSVIAYCRAVDGGRVLPFRASLLSFTSRFAASRTLMDPFRQPQQCSSRNLNLTWRVDTSPRLMCSPPSRLRCLARARSHVVSWSPLNQSCQRARSGVKLDLAKIGIFIRSVLVLGNAHRRARVVELLGCVVQIRLEPKHVVAHGLEWR